MKLQTHSSAYDALAVTASVPFAERMHGKDLHEIILSGVVPPRFRSHIHRAFNEAPIEMIARLTYDCDDATTIIENIEKLAIMTDAEERLATWLRG